MEYNREGYGYDSWFFFYEDFSYFTAKDFNRLGQHHLKELRKQLKEEYRPPSDEDVEYERFIATFESAIDALEAPAIEALVIEAPTIKALLIEAPPVDTNEPAIPFANTTEPSTSPTPIPPQSIPPTDSYLAYTLTFTYTSTEVEFQALQRTGVG